MVVKVFEVALGDAFEDTCGGGSSSLQGYPTEGGQVLGLQVLNRPLGLYYSAK